MSLLVGCVPGDDVHPPMTDQRGMDIVGGQTTDIADLPWQVSLQTGGGSHFCGGTIIAPTWIVTAAHCVGGGAPSRILAGATRLSQPGSGHVVGVARAIRVPGYQDAAAGKDFALLELSAPLPLDGVTVQAIRPVNPADAAAGIDAPGVLATVSGWGALSSNGSYPDALQSVQVPIVSLQEASADYGFAISADQLPAGLRGVGGKDSCQGDSGGPLVVTSPETGEVKLAGVVSWGYGCAHPSYPGMYARVSSFAAFIDDYTGGPPTAVAGDDQVVDSGDLVVLDASASHDVGVGVIVSYTWTQVLGAPVELGAVSGDGTIVEWTAPDVAGELEFELTVTDDRGNTDSDRVTFAVQHIEEPPDDGTDPATPPTDPDATRPPALVGGCAAGGQAAPALPLLLLFAAGLLVARRRRAVARLVSDGEDG